MAAPGSLNPARVYGDTIEYVSRWTVGATGAHTKVWGPGFASVARTAAGEYTVTFTEVPPGPILDVRATHWPQVASEPLIIGPCEEGYTASAKTLLLEAWVIDETAARTEVPDGDQVSISVRWARTT